MTNWLFKGGFETCSSAGGVWLCNYATVHLWASCQIRSHHAPCMSNGKLVQLLASPHRRSSFHQALSFSLLQVCHFHMILSRLGVWLGAGHCSTLHSYSDSTVWVRSVLQSLGTRRCSLVPTECERGTAGDETRDARAPRLPKYVVTTLVFV